MNAIEERIAAVLVNQLKVEHGVIDSEATFASLDVDSLIIVELALLLDGEFGIAIDDGELTNDMTVRDAARLIAAKRAAA